MYFAHSENKVGARHALLTHLQGVEALASTFGAPAGLGQEAALAGLLHDLGKYGERFQRRLQGLDRGVDHWSAGAWVAVSGHKRPDVAFAIMGHHLGLGVVTKDALLAIDPRQDGVQARASHPDPWELLRRLESDRGGSLSPAPPPGQLPMGTPGDLLELRLLFSALVDADYLDTEAHFAAAAHGKSLRPAGPLLDPPTALAALVAHRATLADRPCTPAVRAVRERLWQACLAAADRPVGTFTLTAPTGSGKTLAMLGFALAHAQKHGHSRVVVVLPFLSIVEQTARIYRAILGEDAVLEHHSLVEAPTEDEGDRTGGLNVAWKQRQRAENWDAPIIVTTAVQILESLFSNRPGRCRKLHRLCQSVILFDEAQTLPARLALPTLATLSRLHSRFGASIVFATATQPAFGHLDAAVRAWPMVAAAPTGRPDAWTPTEIVPDAPALFSLLRRVRSHWPAPGATRTWEQLADDMQAAGQALAIVNLTAHAQALASLLPDALHLSTRMCAAHRIAVLTEVRRRLGEGEPCLLVSTQCVEAGVDIDFPTVWRAMAPLDAIAQAAGRCNREGRRKEGNLHVFRPAVDGRPYPGDGYAQAAAVTENLLAGAAPDGLDLDDPALHTRFFRLLFGAQDFKATTDLSTATIERDMPRIAAEYQIIEQEGWNVIVPYLPETAAALVVEARADGISGRWLRAVRHHTISIPKLRQNDPLLLNLEPLLAAEPNGPWFVCRDPDIYDLRLGLLRTGTVSAWIV